jgi:YD repeat-containing protein
VNYNYDQLSRLLTETRNFSNLAGSSTGGNYTLTYGYNLADQVTSITDPFGAQVNYNFDATGRLSGVTGTGFSISTFLSNIQYRAWGAPKSVTFGDNRIAATTHDARMRISSYQLTLSPPDAMLLRNQYEYYADGKLKKMTDLDDHEPSIIGAPDTARHFSRIYDFDHAGRLTRAKGIKPTGVEEDRPFTQSYSYDAFSNLTNRSGRYYYQPITSDPNTFENNRRVGASYAADGQETQSSAPGTTRDWSYDAAGNLVKVKETVTANGQVSTFVTSYDGDGRPVREFLQENPTSTNAYIVRSTVFHGEVVTRLDNAGNKLGTIVDVDDRITPTRISTGNTGGVAWIHIDPLGLSIYGDTKPVFDPMGNRIAWQQVPLGPPPGTYPRTSAGSGLGSLFGSGQDRNCVLNDLPISCQELDRKIWLGVVNVVGRRGIHPEEQPFGIVKEWVEDDLPKQGKSGDTSSNAQVTADEVIKTTTEEDGAGHYEYYYVPQRKNIAIDIGNPPPTLRVRKAIDDARAIILGDPYCRMLVGEKGIKMLDLYTEQGLINEGTRAPKATSSGVEYERFASDNTGAKTSYGAGSYPTPGLPGKKTSAHPITINSRGFFVDGRLASGQDVSTVEGAGFEGLGLSAIRAAVIIHELLHVLGKIPSDGDDPEQSQKNSEMVRRNCFRTLSTSTVRARTLN